jgi:hypothetical protein
MRLRSVPCGRRLREPALVSRRLHGSAGRRSGHPRHGHRTATAPVGPPAVRGPFCRPRKPRPPQATARQSGTARADHRHGPVRLAAAALELLADGAGSLAQRVSIRRQLETPESLLPRAVQLPLRILYVVSRPGDTGFIDPRMTTKSLMAALDPLGASVRIDFCRPPTLARMEQMLRAGQAADELYTPGPFRRPRHVSARGARSARCVSRSRTAAPGIADRPRPGRSVGTLLAQYQIPLVVLEACRSAIVGKTAVFRSVAPRLMQAGVGSVLSMGHAVHVEAARVLLDRFYRELVRGTTIGHAVAQGRSALISAQRPLDRIRPPRPHHHLGRLGSAAPVPARAG